MNHHTTTPRRKKIHSRALAVTTATLVALGGGAVATTATGGAQPAPAPAPEPAPAYPTPEEATQIAVDNVPPSEVDRAWSLNADTSSYDPNQRLSAILLDVEGGTGSSPQQVALFEHGTYIGTTLFEAHAYQHVERVSDSEIKVDYRYLLPGDANADPSGLATSHYILGPDGVVHHEGELPPEGEAPPV
ncbi:MAG TPA: LppP/LprE family lipoprotein [Candidatus Corynebacterium avicola]|uniref:LppP/LprE family lipoprotein n=1 Tax=Candidatus Corynebacterium avicola TaxID=2838527 RepID=A0A9D1RMB2_9CORY|nr:LppP/LprE family lipoprotein [Candidatus Corynebacterium avicola]